MLFVFAILHLGSTGSAVFGELRMKNIVFMTNIKDNKRIDRSKPYEYSVKSWKTWCEKNNVEFFMLDEFKVLKI